MAQILAVSANWKDFPRQFAKLARYYPVKHVPISKFDPETHDDNTLLLIDFHNLSPKQLHALKPCTKKRNDASIGLVTIRSRQQVLQARELGVFHLIDREDRFSNLLLKLRELLGDYSRPNLPAGLPEKTVRTVKSTSAALSHLSMAALSGAPLPVKKLAGSAKDMAATLDAEGLDSWLTAVQSHHSHTYCHTMMVAGHALTFAKALGMSQQEQYLMGLGGLVHDLGKVKIPLSILDKPGKLTAKERELVNKHPIYSKEILESRSEMPKPVVDMALWHHEFIDGSGYPDGLSGDEISERVRLLTIVDIYSALTEKRSYKDAVPPQRALAIMADMGGKLDAGLLRKFSKLISRSDFGRIRRRAV
ncbi:phosphohydrolase [Labrenzia sp. VG12]|nr:phosphohydrolase [Labrenzia sp. VG12]